jgi:hypothetical protein
MTLVSSSAEASRAGTAWIFPSVPAGPHRLTFTVKIASGIANNTVLDCSIALNYSDARANPMPPSRAGAPVTVRAGPVPQPARPTISARNPAPGQTGVPTGTDIRITFSAPMNRVTASGAFSISPDVPGSFKWDGNTLVFTPARRLDPGRRYTVLVSPEAQDENGIPLDQQYSWSFTTGTGEPSVTAGTSWLPLVLVLIIIALIAALVLAGRRKGPVEPMPAEPAPMTPDQARRRPAEKTPPPAEPVPKTAAPPLAEGAPPGPAGPLRRSAEPRAVPEPEVPAGAEILPAQPAGPPAVPTPSAPEAPAQGPTSLSDSNLEALMQRLRQH